MSELKYAKNIITGVRPDLQLAGYRIKTNEVVPGMETRLLHMDEAALKDSFYLSCFGSGKVRKRCWLNLMFMILMKYWL